MVIAPDADADARAAFARKKNLRVLLTGGLPDPAEAGTLVKSIAGGYLMQSRDTGRIAEADLLIYAPGTQHSSLLPSYLTRGVGEAIEANLRAIKLLITNLREDAETLTLLVSDPRDRRQSGERILTLAKDEVEMRRPTDSACSTSSRAHST